MDRKLSLGKENWAVNLPATPEMKRLGFGTGVGVYRLLPAGDRKSPWALKKLARPRGRDVLQTMGKRLRDEADVLKKLNHPNIVGFRGFFTAPDGRECLALEECQRSLYDIIEDHREVLEPFPASTAWRVAFEIGKALDYIHNVVHLLHGDIKSMNILINGNFDAVKLCDFGVSLPLKADGSLDEEIAGGKASYVGTPVWCAPEVCERTEHHVITDKADIFAYGLTIWEVLAKNVPHCQEEIESDSSFDAEDYQDSFDELIGTRPPVPERVKDDPSYSSVISLFIGCTEEDYRSRYSAKDVLQFCLKNNITNKKVE